MDRQTEDYILSNITKEDKDLAELYRLTHLHVVNPNMVSGHLQGLILKMISRMINPLSVLEIGTFTGYSTICLAEGLAPGGKIHTIEVNDELEELSNKFFLGRNLQDKIVRYTGNALEIIPSMEMEFDLVFIDGDKREYSAYYDLLFDKVAPGKFIIADNVLWGGKVTDSSSRDPQTRGIIDFNNKITNDPRVEKVIVPVRDGLTLIRKLG